MRRTSLLIVLVLSSAALLMPAAYAKDTPKKKRPATGKKAASKTKAPAKKTSPITIKKPKRALFPKWNYRLRRGVHPVRIRNPNSYRVRVGLRTTGKRRGGKNFSVRARRTVTVYVPRGDYAAYFIYTDRPHALFKGDNFSLRGNRGTGVEIKLVRVYGGNYGIRQVN